MSMRYPGGLIATSPVNAAYPSGVWTPSQSIPYQQQNVWTRDQYWPYTTLLLNGNGTNGAQNNTFLDSSTNNFTITRNGNTTQGSFTPYEANGYWSNYFDGTSDYLTLGGQSAFSFGTGDFTIEGWFFINVNGTHALIDFRPASTNGAYILLAVNTSNQPYLYANSSEVITGSAITLNAWHHFALTRSGTSTKLFIDGAQSGSTYTDSTNYTVGASRPMIGALGFNPGAGADLNGYLSNVRILKGTALYTGSYTVPTAPLTAITNTSLLTCQSNRFIDNSNNAFAITVNGNTAVQSFQPFPGATTWSGSVLGGSGYFDGTGDVIYATETSSQFTFGTGDYTYECWVFPTTGASTQRTIFGRTSTGDTSVPYIYLVTTTGVVSVYYSSTIVSGTTAIPSNTWTHIVVSRLSGTTRIFVNGTQEGSASDTTNLTSPTAIMVGGSGTSAANPFTGYISNVRILKGTGYSSITVPTAPLTAITNTQLLLNFTNAGIFDSAMMNDFETAGNAQVSTSVVKYGTGSMAFDGSGDYLVRPDAEFLRLSSGDFTIEAWVYLTGNQPQFDGGVASYGATTTSAGWAVSITGSSAGGTLNRLVYGVNASASGGAPLYGVNGIALNTWTHIAVTKSGTTVRLFINGSLDNSGTVTATPTTSTSYFFYVGTQAYDPTATTRQFAGYIDDLRITKGAARYIGNFTPPVARMPGQ